MKLSANSINHSENGCSVCEAGKENYTTFHPAHRPSQLFYQYDYRHSDNELFSIVAPTLEQCREKRDQWIQAKNRKLLYPSITQMIQNNQRLSRCNMAYQISRVDSLHDVAIFWDFFSREEVVETFNQMFGTDIE